MEKNPVETKYDGIIPSNLSLEEIENEYKLRLGKFFSPETIDSIISKEIDTRCELFLNQLVEKKDQFYDLAKNYDDSNFSANSVNSELKLVKINLAEEKIPALHDFLFETYNIFQKGKKISVVYTEIEEDDERSIPSSYGIGSFFEWISRKRANLINKIHGYYSFSNSLLNESNNSIYGFSVPGLEMYLVNGKMFGPETLVFFSSLPEQSYNSIGSGSIFKNSDYSSDILDYTGNVQRLLEIMTSVNKKKFLKYSPRLEDDFEKL